MTARMSAGKNWWEESDGRLVVDDVNEAVLELHAEVERLRGELAEIDARVQGARGTHRRNWKVEAENERLREHQIQHRMAYEQACERAEMAEAKVEHLLALLDPDNDTSVGIVADAEREARGSFWDATTPAERAATGVDGVSRHVAHAVLAALTGEVGE